MEINSNQKENIDIDIDINIETTNNMNNNQSYDSQYYHYQQQQFKREEEQGNEQDPLLINTDNNADGIIDTDKHHQQQEQQESYQQHRWKDILKTIKPFILYCSFSFMFSFDPSEPYIVDYLTSVLHIDSTIVYEQIYPYWTYSYFIFLLIFGFLGEMVGYKCIIIIGMIAKTIASGILLVQTNSITLLIFDEITDGMAFAAYIVFLAYIYYSLDPDDYQKMACRVNVGYLVGVVSSGLLGQLLVDYVPLIILVIIAFITNVVGLVVALFFTNYRSEQLFSFKELCRELFQAYKSTDIIRWYIWSGVAISIHQIVLTYWQSLFLQVSNEEQWNGYISSSAYFFASFVALIPTRLGNNINNIKNIILVGFGLFAGVFLILMGMGSNIILSSISFVVYNCCFEFMSPIVNVQIAKKLSSRVGILFSFNIMIALAIQVVIQMSVGQKMLNLDIRNQFVYFGACLFLLSLGFTILFTSIYLSKRLKTK